MMSAVQHCMVAAITLVLLLQVHFVVAEDCNLTLRAYSDVAAGPADATCCSACPRNASCVATDVCACAQSYRLFRGRCAPVCSPKCPRGEVCQDAPNVCRCRIGYERDAKGGCKPLCPGGCGPHGFCHLPNLCDCERGFIMMDRQCVPFCEGGCPNGRCIAPNACICNPGFVRSATGACLAACRGTDCGGHGRCDVARDACACDEGYTNEGPHMCVPVCPGGCGAGVCVEPSTCHCPAGHHPPRRGEPCRPICTDGCPNGRCVAPQRCECNPGFVRSRDNKAECQPQCSRPCVNGECTAPEHCTCRDGFQTAPAGDWATCIAVATTPTPAPTSKSTSVPSTAPTSTLTLAPNKPPDSIPASTPAPSTAAPLNSSATSIPLSVPSPISTSPATLAPTSVSTTTSTQRPASSSIPSSLNISFTDEAEPICICHNGKCTNNTCICSDGFVPSDHNASLCVPGLADSSSNPPCSDSCLHSHCEEGVCVCDEGFLLNEEDSTICVPLTTTTPECSDTCHNGHCEGEICVCDNGYEHSDTEQTTCMLLSTARMKEHSHSVTEQCTCHHGICQNGTCVCETGYEPSKTDAMTCVSSTSACAHACHNGRCVVDKCLCNEGYVKSGTEEGACVPDCPGGCIQGKCVSPGACECQPGFELSSHVPRACVRATVSDQGACVGGCGHGRCADDIAACDCDEGWSGATCDQKNYEEEPQLSTLESIARMLDPRQCGLECAFWGSVVAMLLGGVLVPCVSRLIVARGAARRKEEYLRRVSQASIAYWPPSNRF